MSAMKNVDDILGLTPMQELMLTSALTASGPDRLVNQVTYEIDGDLDVALFRAAWSRLAERHPALRTAVLWDGLERPVQVVRTQVQVPWREHDVSESSQTDAAARVSEIRAADVAEGFELGSAPLFRCTVIRGRGSHTFLWTVHHLVIDRWSHGTLFSELAEIYEALRRGEAPALPPPVAFREYVSWVSEQSVGDADRYWTKSLRGFEAPSLLATSDGSEPTAERTTSRASMAAHTYEQLRARASEWGTTVGSVLLAAVGVVLARRTGRLDVAFGLTVAGRPPQLAGVERTVGSFVNNVPLRIRWDRSADWVHCLAEIQREQIARQPYEHLSPARIRDLTSLPAGQPLFDVLVVPNLAEMEPAPWSSIELTATDSTFDAAFPFVLGTEIRDGRLDVTVVHDSGADGASLAESVVEALADLASSQPEPRVADLVPEVLPLAPVETPAPARTSAPDVSHSVPHAVARIWADVLGVESVDHSQDFFDLGGSSIQAVRILHGAERLTGTRLGISTLFQARTLGEFIRRLDVETEGEAPRAIPAADRDRPLPLSFAQERLWALDRIEGASSVYNLAFAYRIQGTLDVDRLANAVDALVLRHEVLRVVYGDTPDGPAQTPRGAGRASWSWTTSLDESSEADVRARVERDAATPFDLEAGPLFRSSLHRIRPDDHVLAFVVHHSLADAWSVRVLEEELSSAYSGPADGARPALEPLPVHYVDYAAWQRTEATTESFAKHLEYWRASLADVPPLDLPTDFPRPPVQSFRGAIRRVVLDPELTERLKGFARAEGTTLFNVLMAAFHLLLHRYSGQRDVVVGTPFAGRIHPDVDRLVGMFVNTILIRTKPEGEESFRSLLGQVISASTAAQQHQELPFERLVEVLQPKRDLSRNPLFQVMFALQDRRAALLNLPDATVSPFEQAQDTSKFDLTLYMQEAEGEGKGLEGIWEYATDLFEASAIDRMQGHFENLLRAVIERPDGTLAEADLVGEVERRALLGPRGAAVEEPLFIDRFRAQVARTPDRIAVVHADVHTTYEELERRSDLLAGRLVREGVGPEHSVGVCLHRSADLVVALLGVLKSGASYVPLDPDYPPERLRYMLADTGASLLLTSTDLRSSVPSSYSGETVLVDQGAAEPAGPTPAVAIGRDQLAYTIYTSGSTGRPKGVEVSHGNLAHFTAAMLDRPGLTDDDVVLAKTTVAFDPSVVELLTTLVVGARMVIADASEVTTGRRLARAIERSGATLLQATPATFHMLFEAGWEGHERLRILVGGEALPVELARRLASTCGEVWNIYGPTEGTVWSTCWRVPNDVRSVRIGTPMGDERVVVLDDRMEPAPTGVLGELYVGGAGVTRGYRNRPDLTDAAYVSNPFSEIPGARLYRTGDVARVLDDGSLECLGRRDNQVQLRGFRIELAEIESVLSEHDAIHRAVVTVVGAGSPDARLVAYVVFAQGAAPTVSEVRAFLRDRMPDYMVPGLIVEMDEFPTTPSGKVDRRALPDPLARAAVSTPDFVPPQTEGELALAAVWMALLGRDRVSTTDNFFELGGHSLLAIRAVAEIAEARGVSIEPRSMFFQTLGQLAAHLDHE